MFYSRKLIVPMLYGPNDIPFVDWTRSHQAQIEEKTTLAAFSEELNWKANMVAFAYDQKDQDFLCFLVGGCSSSEEENFRFTFKEESFQFIHECDCGLSVTMVCYTLDYHFVVSF